MRAVFRGDLRPVDLSVRVEPWLNRAVAFAHAMKLVHLEKGKAIWLTPEGVKRAEALATSDGIMSDEIAFLKEVAPKLTEALITKIWRMEDIR